MPPLVRKLTRVGQRSICVVIPAEYIEELGWKERQRVVLTKRGETISVKDFKPSRAKKTKKRKKKS